MADVTKTVGIIFQGQDQTGAALASVERGLGGIGTAGKSAATGLDDISTSTERLGRSAGQVDTLANSLKALAASLVAKAFIDANVEAEKFDRSMTLLKGSSQAAGAEFTYISKTADTLGLNLFEAAAAYTSLTAATRGTALEGEQTRAIFEAVSKAMGSLGKSSADTQGALLAISQIVSKGTVSLEELRGQLGERLPGAFQLAAQAMGVTTQELDKLVSSGNLTAEEFLPKFTQALNDAFGDTSKVEGYAAAFARLQNAIGLAFIDIGKTGIFDGITRGIEALFAIVTGAISAFKLFGETWANFAYTVNTGDILGFGDRFSESFEKAASTTKSLRDAIFGVETAAKVTSAAVSSAGADVNLFAGDVARYNEAQKAALNSAKEFADALKKVKDIEGLNALGGALTDAFQRGKLSAAEFDAAVNALAEKQGKLTGSTKEAADALKRQADETRRAEENAQKFALELEKLASNERIKFIEAKVTLDVERVKAQTEQVKAAFESVNNTINSTGDVLSTLFGLFKDFNTFDFSTIRAIEKQLEMENKRRDDALQMQKDLTEAQIDVLRAQARALSGGDAVIKIDGAGLQPHLEAFMFEILKKIQTRVNADGLNLLLGV